MSDSELQPNPPAPPPAPSTGSESPELEPGHSSRYTDMEFHELVRILDSVDDERARARFRESVYISMFVWIAIAWFLLYGPQVIFRQPRLVDPSVALRRQHDAEVTELSLAPALRHIAPQPKPPANAPRVDSKLLEKLRAAAPTPAPQPTTPPPPPTSQPIITPPVQPLPPAPAPKAPTVAAIPDAPAPSPKLALNTPTNPGDAIRNAANAASRGGFSSAGTVPIRPSKNAALNAGMDIVSDTQGVDFTDYMRRLKAIVYQHWGPLLPESINPPISTSGITGLDVKIMPNGDIGGVSIISGSGTQALDRAAWGSIVTSGKFPPLPKDFHGPLLELHAGYYVNREPKID